MKKIFFSLCLLSVLLLTSGCLAVGASSGSALIVSTVEGISAINDVSYSKTGTACNSNILGIVSAGNSSIEAAKNNGNITKVSTIDRTYFSILGLYGQSCLIIKGN